VPSGSPSLSAPPSLSVFPTLPVTCAPTSRVGNWFEPVDSSCETFKDCVDKCLCVYGQEPECVCKSGKCRVKEKACATYLPDLLEWRCPAGRGCKAELKSGFNPLGKTYKWGTCTPNDYKCDTYADCKAKGACPHPQDGDKKCDCLNGKCRAEGLFCLKRGFTASDWQCDDGYLCQAPMNMVTFNSQRWGKCM